MDVNEFTTLINTVGFPIGICIYLLYSNEKLRTVLERNTSALEHLTSVIDKEKEKEK